MRTHEAPIGAVLSLITGKMIPVKGSKGSGFAEMQELAEFLVGHPILTHEFGSKALAADLAERCRARIPAHLAAETGESVHDGDTAWALRNKWSVVYGDTITIEVGEP